MKKIDMTLKKGTTVVEMVLEWLYSWPGKRFIFSFIDKTGDRTSHSLVGVINSIDIAGGGSLITSCYRVDVNTPKFGDYDLKFFQVTKDGIGSVAYLDKDGKKMHISGEFRIID